VAAPGNSIQQDRKSDPEVQVNPAAESPAHRPSFLGEVFAFLMHNGKWWLLPIVLVLLLVGFLVVTTSSTLAIYALF
jgi:hypothetical protein